MVLINSCRHADGSAVPGEVLGQRAPSAHRWSMLPTPALRPAPTARVGCRRSGMRYPGSRRGSRRCVSGARRTGEASRRASGARPPQAAFDLGQGRRGADIDVVVADLQNAEVGDAGCHGNRPGPCVQCPDVQLPRPSRWTPASGCVHPGIRPTQGHRLGSGSVEPSIRSSRRGSWHGSGPRPGPSWERRCASASDSGGRAPSAVGGVLDRPDPVQRHRFPDDACRSKPFGAVARGRRPDPGASGSADRPTAIADPRVVLDPTRRRAVRPVELRAGRRADETRCAVNRVASRPGRPSAPARGRNRSTSPRPSEVTTS